MTGFFGGFPVGTIVATLVHPPPSGPYYWQSTVQRYTFGSMFYWYFGMRCTTDPVNGGPGWTIDYWEGTDGINFGVRPYASSDSRSIAPTAKMTQDSITCGSGFDWKLHAVDIGGNWNWHITS
jgi:hypothetical protein